MIPYLISLYHETLVDWGLYKYLQVFNQITFRATFAIIVSAFMVWLIGPRVIRWLIKQKIGDAPNFDHADLNRLTHDKHNTPTMGGVIISGTIFLVTFLLADISSFYVSMGLVCLLCFTAIGVVDDWLKLTSASRKSGGRQGLYSWEKLLFQVGFSLLFGFFIYYHGLQNETTRVLTLPFQRVYHPVTKSLVEGLIILSPWMFGFLTIMVIAGTSNAVNLTDGMDGLSSGIMVIVSFAFMVLALVAGTEVYAKFLLIPHIPESGELAVICGAMVGACVGFLWYNCHPAQVFMGDTGSLPLGALIGYIAVIIRQEVLLFVIGGMLVLNVVSVIMQVSYFKFTNGKRIFRCTPIHHHFHLGGWTEQQVVVRFWLITIFLAVLALTTIKLR